MPRSVYTVVEGPLYLGAAEVGLGLMHVHKLVVFFGTNWEKHFLPSNQQLLGKHLLPTYRI